MSNMPSMAWPSSMENTGVENAPAVPFLPFLFHYLSPLSLKKAHRGLSNICHCPKLKDTSKVLVYNSLLSDAPTSARNGGEGANSRWHSSSPQPRTQGVDETPQQASLSSSTPSVPQCQNLRERRQPSPIPLSLPFSLSHYFSFR